MNIAALPVIDAYAGSVTPAGIDVVGVDLPVGRLTAYRAIPSGVPRGTVLFVPGYTGSKEDFTDFLPLVRELGWTALAITRRGQADSAAPQDPGAYSLDEEAADVVRVARLLASTQGPVHLVGHSLGGVITRAAALLAPELFASYTILCSGPHGWPNRKYLERHLVAESGTAALWDATNPALIGVPDDKLSPLLRFLHVRMLETSPLSIVAGAEILELPDDTTAELEATGLRILVAHGSEDDAWPIPWQRDMAARLGARYEVIPNAFHSPQIENAPATAFLLNDFWR